MLEKLMRRGLKQVQRWEIFHRDDRMVGWKAETQEWSFHLILLVNGTTEVARASYRGDEGRREEIGMGMPLPLEALALADIAAQEAEDKL